MLSSFNLTFDYAKKIERGSYADWSQEGNQLPGVNASKEYIQVENATLNFKYKIDNLWPATSPNSEIRVFISGHMHTEAIPLTSANTTFGDAKAGGFDVTSLIAEGVNISVTIQLYLADNFELDGNRTISIDNVSLWIAYSIIEFEAGEGNPPIVAVWANINYLNVGNTTYLTVTCQSGTGNVDTCWYQNPFTGQNITLGTNIQGTQTYNLNFTSDAEGTITFTFWANSTIGLEASDSINIAWYVPPNYWWIILLILLIVVSAFLVAYLLYFRYPRVIRDIRKTRKGLLKGKETSPVELHTRDALVKDIQTAEQNLEKRELQKYSPLMNKIQPLLHRFKEKVKKD